MKHTNRNPRSQRSKRFQRFQRFDPVTVRAAARLVRMGTSGRVSAPETEYYLRQLAEMDSPFPGAYRALQRLATRRAAFGRTGVVGAPSRLRRRGPRPQWVLNMELERLGASRES